MCYLVGSHDTNFTPKSLHVSRLSQTIFVCTCHDTNHYRGYSLPLTCIYVDSRECACIVCPLAFHVLQIHFILCWKLAISNVDGWRNQVYGLWQLSLSRKTLAKLNTICIFNKYDVLTSLAWDL